MPTNRILFQNPQVLMNKIQGDLMTKDDLNKALFFFSSHKRDDWFHPDKMDHLTMEVITFAEAEGRCLWGSTATPFMKFLSDNDILLSMNLSRNSRGSGGIFFSVDEEGSRVEVIEE